MKNPSKKWKGWHFCCVQAFNIHIRSFSSVTSKVLSKVSACCELATTLAERAREHVARMYALVSIQPEQQFHRESSFYITTTYSQ